MTEDRKIYSHLQLEAALCIWEDLLERFNILPDVRLVIADNGRPLAYSILDKVRQVNPAALVDNKSLSAVLMKIREERRPRPWPLQSSGHSSNSRSSALSSRSQQLAPPS